MTRFACLILTLLLAACANQGEQVAETSPDEQAAGLPGPESAPPPPPPVERPIPPESVYSLLVAEFALRRRSYDEALDRYLELAPVLRDPGVSAHTTHLAQFLQREPEALQAVSLWTELEPDSVEANATLALLLARRGDSVAAADHLGAVARNGGEANFPVLINGFSQLSPQQQSQLTASVNALALEFPEDTELLLTQALLLDELGQADRALEKLEELFEVEPDKIGAVLLEAKLLQETGARKPLRRVETLLEEQPDNEQLRLQYARMLTRDDMEKARKQFEILAASSPGDGQLLLPLALINREIGDNLAAKSYLRQMLQHQQQEGTVYYYLGQIAEDEGEVQSAIYNYMKVTDGREFFSANARVGQLYIDGNEPQKFAAYFDQMRTRYPERSERLFGIEADLLSRSGNLEGAVVALSRGLEAYPESASLRYARAMIGEQLDNLALMERDLRAIIASDPKNATALNALGYTLADRTQRFDEAHELISRALALEPDEPAILDSMGWVLYRRGEYEEAIGYLERAYAAFPDPEVAAHLGEVLWVSGDTGGAVAIWEAALEEAPDHEVLVTTIRRLRARESVIAS